jgi:hypothetical protein
MVIERDSPFTAPAINMAPRVNVASKRAKALVPVAMSWFMVKVRIQPQKTSAGLA